MAGHYNYYPRLQEEEEEVVVNAPLHSGGRVFCGMKAAATDVTDLTPFAPILQPGSYLDGCFPDTSQPSMKKKNKKNKSMTGTFSSEKHTLYNMPANPDDPEFERRRRKAVQSRKNREGSKLEEEVHRETLTDLADQIKSLQLEKMIRQQRVQQLELQQQNWGNGSFVPQDTNK